MTATQQGPGLMETFRTVKEALPGTIPILKWLADPDAPPMTTATMSPEQKDALAKVSSFIIGKVPQTRDEIAAFLQQPGRLEGIKEKASENPQMVVDFISEMEPPEIEALLTAQPEMAEKIKEAFIASAPDLSLSSLFNFNVDSVEGDLKVIFAARLENLDLSTIDTAAEVGQFFSALPRAQIDNFIATFKEKTGVEIKIEANASKADIQKLITEGITTAHSGWGPSGWWHNEASMVAEVRLSIRDAIGSIKSGETPLTPKAMSEFVGNTSKTPEGKRMIMSLIAEGDPSKLKDPYKALITAELLANSDKSLINGVLADNVAGGLNSIKSFMNGLPDSIKNMLGPILKLVTGFVEKMVGADPDMDKAPPPAAAPGPVPLQ